MKNPLIIQAKSCNKNRNSLQLAVKKILELKIIQEITLFVRQAIVNFGF